LATPVDGFEDWVVLMAEIFMRNRGYDCWCWAGHSLTGRLQYRGLVSEFKPARDSHGRELGQSSSHKRFFCLGI